MIKEIYPYMLVALIGAFVHILSKLAGLEKLTETFSLKIWLHKNRFTTLYGFGATFLTIFILWSTKELNWASAILAGYTGDSLMKTKFPQANTEGDNEQPAAEPEQPEPEIKVEKGT
jgi:hypothetical protein